MIVVGIQFRLEARELVRDRTAVLGAEQTESPEAAIQQVFCNHRSDRHEVRPNGNVVLLSGVVPRVHHGDALIGGVARKVTADAPNDAVVLFTEWNQYRALDLEKIKGLMKTPIFIDLRNVYSPEKMREQGFAYYGVGRN